MIPTTPPQARKLLAPFINARFIASGYPRAQGVDLHAPGLNVRDASILAVTDDGVTHLLRTTCGSELLTWDELIGFAVFAFDADGDRRTASRSFSLVSERVELAA